MTKRYAEFILRHKWATIIAAVLWIMLMGAGAQHLTFTNDYRVFFGEDNPQLQAFENLQDTYSKNDNVMLVLAPASGEVFTRETLGAVAWLTERAWETPYSTRVESLSNYQHTAADGDDLLVEDLAYEPEILSDADLARIREIAAEHDVPLFSAPPLARALFRTTEIGAEIPARLYTAVAQVLAYIYQLNETLKPGQQRPQPPVVEIDEDE